MKKEIVNVTCSWLSMALPWLSPIKDTIEFVYSLSDQIVFGKLYDIMINQDSDFDDWLKLSEKFDEDKLLFPFRNPINPDTLIFGGISTNICT